MANSFDLFPLGDDITQGGSGKLNDVWKDFLATFNQNLTEYLNEFGITPPTLTTSQRDSIKSPKNGQTIYNISLNTNQYFKNGTWTSY
jgi:hypothetical protein